jgi:hypothetical protein
VCELTEVTPIRTGILSFWEKMQKCIIRRKKYLIEQGTVKDWDDLLKRFSVETLTKEFYAELSNWYFWAMQNVDFPCEKEQEKEINNSTAIIRLNDK